MKNFILVMVCFNVIVLAEIVKWIGAAIIANRVPWMKAIVDLFTR